jgi:hypothetical protein
VVYGKFPNFEIYLNKNTLFKIIAEIIPLSGNSACLIIQTTMRYFGHTIGHRQAENE